MPPRGGAGLARDALRLATRPFAGAALRFRVGGVAALSADFRAPDARRLRAPVPLRGMRLRDLWPDGLLSEAAAADFGAEAEALGFGGGVDAAGACGRTG